MDRTKLMMGAGAVLLASGVGALGVSMLGGEDAGDARVTPLPQEVASAPTAASQPPAPRTSAPRVRTPQAQGEARLDLDQTDDEGDLTIVSAEEEPPEAPRLNGPEPRDYEEAPERGAASRPPVRPAPPDIAVSPDPLVLRDDISPRAPLLFCFRGVIPTPNGCATKEAVLSLAGEEIGVEGADGRTAALTVTLADPEDMTAPEVTARTCDQYLGLKAQGWGGLTSADMARELKMNRFCGLIAMARRAEPSRRGGMSAITYGALEKVAPSDWPAIGPVSMRGAAIAMDGEDARVWRVETEDASIQLRDVTSADFDEDGYAEVLVHTAVTAKGGTARAGGYVLAERDGEAVRLKTADLY